MSANPGAHCHAAPSGFPLLPQGARTHITADAINSRSKNGDVLQYEPPVGPQSTTVHEAALPLTAHL